jgi:type II secretory pathway component PulF
MAIHSPLQPNTCQFIEIRNSADRRYQRNTARHRQQPDKYDFKDVRTRLIQGQSFSEVLKSNGFFPSFLTEMVAVGETTGSLESTLASAADYFESKVSKRITRLTGLIEPAMIIVLGLGVAFIAITMISTLYGMSGAL